ncbi:hypothetical protein RHSIM_Rhsim06G0010300 [Rhododendron simsii]|uniref:CRAL-TRIO domain-containing protein n=1 Tax=Rhododendron simsii TaxID=118357 RepID=A0A834GVN9_RHOSS|nr:hypothetical protein RHSIM_Rhsim06G0010300 [Rhododendron simsii]
MIMNATTDTAKLSQSKQEKLLDKLGVFKIQGRDKCGRKLLLIIGKLLPAKHVTAEALKKYLEEKIMPGLDEQPFSVVYVHTGVRRSENFPGISALRLISDAIPIDIKDRLEAVYFLHPGLQSRLFLATFGRLVFSGGLYRKVKYVSRLEFLWEHLRRNEMELPESVYDHNEKLEYRPMMDYGLESDHPRSVCSALAMVDSPFSVYSMRCIA